MFNTFPHRPQGALRQPDGSLLWRLWAPYHERVQLVIWPDGQEVRIEMTPQEPGFHVHRQADVADGLRYAYRLPDQRILPDPASRSQPEGVHAPSAVFSPGPFRWTDQDWTGVPPDELVLYELHVGTFTPEGTLEAIIPRLPQLRELGVTAIELMPLAQFPGERNWGYDGVYPFAVQNSYGGPQALQRLVESAHRQQMAVFLDVVYNHLGPEGNYCGAYGPYFTDRYHTPWGQAVNMDGADCEPVRQFVIDNACMWVRDFHVDGLRLDAVHAIFDFGARHVLAELQAAVQVEARRQGRRVQVIAETNQNDVRLIDPPHDGGYGLDGVWNDDFHHSIRALLAGEREGYYRDFGQPQQLVKTFNDVFVYDGCYSPFRRRNHGNRVRDRDRSAFVVCVHNHDQIGNRARGDRPITRLPRSACRLACGLLMLSPCVPLLFMGEEYGEERPFPFFCSFGDAELIQAVREGRREEFAALEFEWGEEILDPQDPATFAAARLSWEWSGDSPAAEMRRLYTDLLRARRTWPALRDRQATRARLTGPEDADPPPLLVIERGGNRTCLAWANLTSRPQPCFLKEQDGYRLRLSTEQTCYGGRRNLQTFPHTLEPFELILLGQGDEHP